MERPTGARSVSRRAFISALSAGLPLQLPQPSHPENGCRELKRPDLLHVYACRVFTARGPGIEGLHHQVFTAAPPVPPAKRRDVIVLHEITGANVAFFQYVDTLVDAGFTVHCPVLFSTAPPSGLRKFFVLFEACGPSSDFRCFTQTETSRVNQWLVELATDVAGSERRKLGVIGMCLTGIQPLGMLRCRSVVAPVLCQPTLPTRDVVLTHPPPATGRPIAFTTWSRDPEAERDLGLPQSDIDFAYARVRDEDLKMLLVRYQHDPISSSVRADRLVEMFKPRLELFELAGHEHSSLVTDPGPGEPGRKKVVEFLKAIL